MGSIFFHPEVLADTLSETVGYKAGLALSLVEVCDHLSGTKYPDLIRASEDRVVRLRSEEYDELFYKLLHRVGHTKTEYNGDIYGIGLYHKYKGTRLAKVHEHVTELFTAMLPGLADEAERNGTKLIDPTPFLRTSFEKYGKNGLKLAMERIDVLARGLNLSPHSGARFIEWANPIQLRALFSGTNSAPQVGAFIDQRFIDYLEVNRTKLSKMHWRKFEELTAEFFAREGYRVQLGPGSNDDGVDVRVWKPGDRETDHPHCLIQCKRQKDKVERVVVKGLSADVQFEGAEYGLIVTTSELSIGARQTIAARGYPIREVDREALGNWLEKLRTPGTGIVRV